MHTLKETKRSGPMINEDIRASRLQVITKDGENIGEISRLEALRMASAEGLDLVLLTEAGPEGLPIAKIMDFGKVLYERKKKQVEAKKHQKTVQIKEIKIRPKIGDHDYQTKIKMAVQFLKAGKHVKMSLFFRGRENVTKDQRGKEIFDKITKSFEESGLTNIATERETSMGQSWFRIYYLK